MVECHGKKIAVACPSYRRPRCRSAEYIPEINIYIDESDRDDYELANEHGNVVCCANGIQGNLPRVRNYILDQEFNAGADIVVIMDDDVSSLGWFKPSCETDYGFEIHKITHESFYDFIVYGSELCEQWGFGMWGVNYSQDRMLYQHYCPFSTHKSAVGQFMVFVKNDLRFDENLPLKEDYDMCIQQQNKYRGVLMLNFVHVNGDFGELEGGTACRRNIKSEFEQFKLFKKKWGSEIVKGAARLSAPVRKKYGKRTRIKYQHGYDFSHPIVRVPIDGV